MFSAILAIVLAKSPLEHYYDLLGVVGYIILRSTLPTNIK